MGAERLLAAVTSLLPLLIALAPIGSVPLCTSAGALGGVCSEVGDGVVTVGAELQRPGTPATPSPVWYVPPPAPYVYDPPLICHNGAETAMRVRCDYPEVEDDDADPATPSATIADFVSFAPAPAVPTSEPGAFAVRNLHANFIASASTHTRQGVLLGQPAAAEFTPYAFEWDYGDGTTVTTRTTGSTWQSLGLAEFTPTPTSHVYTERGTYPVTLTTYYTVRAAYADGQWWQVAGVLPITSAPVDIRVVSVDTVLVDKDCVENPSGPGC
jgi:hypothetical protein